MTLMIPSLAAAEDLLLEGQSQNPGLWAAHSRNTALAARLIAEQVPGMNPEAAYILGLLHDIGRRAGVFDMRHIMDGYQWMMARGFADCARICLTHSFPLQDVESMSGSWDGTSQDLAEVESFLEAVEYDDYDRLIQLCDAVALPQGFCLIEKRIVDVGLRRGLNHLTLQKWQAFFHLQQAFETRIGRSIYTLLPGVVETTFGF